MKLDSIYKLFLKYFPQLTALSNIENRNYNIVLVVIDNNLLKFLARDDYYSISSIDVIVNLSNLEENINKYKIFIIIDDDFLSFYKRNIRGLIVDNKDYIQFAKTEIKQWSLYENSVKDLNDDIFIFDGDVNRYLNPNISYDNEETFIMNLNFVDDNPIYNYSLNDYKNKEFIFIIINNDKRERNIQQIDL